VGWGGVGELGVRAVGGEVPKKQLFSDLLKVGWVNGVGLELGMRVVWGITLERIFSDVWMVGWGAIKGTQNQKITNILKTYSCFACFDSPKPQNERREPLAQKICEEKPQNCVQRKP